MVRAFYFLILAALAAGVIGVQLDRQAYGDPAVLPVVPAPMRAVAQQRMVEIAVTSAEAGQDITGEARDLVRKRPLPAHHLVLFAQAAELAGEREEAILALELSAVRGWREPVPQLAVAQASLLSGNYAAAAQRLAALSVTGAAPDQTNALLAAMIADEGGRDALADLLTREGTWKGWIVQRIRPLGTDEQFADIIAMAWDRGADLNCTQIRPTARSLLRAGQPDQAARIWQGPCAREQLAAN